ncbi:MAG: small ribosomal subunit biogenesis GTPase RsgA [Porticoccaceae bacterium]
MAKRKLSHQQRRRIAGHKERLRQGDTVAAEDDALGTHCEGLVVTRYGKQADVLALPLAPGAQPVRCHIRANLGDLVTGDRVIWRPGEPTGVVESVLPRNTLMSRPDTQGQLRPVVANVDQIAVVFAPEPAPHQNLIDRYLVAIEQLGIEPLLIFNKMELDPTGQLADLLGLYRRLGYTLLSVSAKQGLGLDALAAALRDRVTVLVGQSGAGKSSLINRIHPEAEAATGELSLVAKGRHTTTAARFYVLSEGGCLIDSPGIREFGLIHLDREQIAAGFVEFRPWLGTCRFRDCRHRDEPGCSIVEAFEAGKISAERLASYHHIIADMG